MSSSFINPLTRDDILAQLRTLKAELTDRYAISQIGIFGSVARNEATAASDIDIVVHMQPDLLKRACLKAELEEHFGRPVDVVRYWYGMNQYLKRRIDREALYA
ncbi:MAG: nucleotidyltransferase family protein [Leptolyngbyaceae cyanobacterium SM2_5_2]|nr:nucleotidyltransferase family protein [Leptolyngbyaceae cyanobacterium SM2_5_2]